MNSQRPLAAPELSPLDHQDDLFDTPVDFEELTRLLGEPLPADSELPFPEPLSPGEVALCLSWLNEDIMGDGQSGGPPARVTMDRLSHGDVRLIEDEEEEEEFEEEDIEEESVRPLTPFPDTLLDSISEGGLPISMASGRIELKAALEANRACQEAVRQALDDVEETLEDTAKSSLFLGELQQALPELSTHRSTSQEDPFQTFFRFNEQGAIDVPDDVLVDYKELYARYRLSTKDPRWSAKQRRVLARVVRQQYQRSLTERAMEAHQHAGGPLSTLHEELERIRNLKNEEINADPDGLDWEAVARAVPRKTAADCRLQWMNVDRPGINHDKWTEAELADLKRFGDQYLALHPTNTAQWWTAIAERLDTNRTAFACAQEYQRRWAKHGKTGRWRAEEDEALRRAVGKYGEADWSRIATEVPGRTGIQCLHRWRNSLQPNIRRGKWTEVEDSLLVTAVARHGASSWHRIQEMVPGRTEVQCRERWSNVLDPNIRRSAFTAEEDVMLRGAVEELGEGKWAAVAARIPGRTDNQCWRRWKRLRVLGTSTLSPPPVKKGRPRKHHA